MARNVVPEGPEGIVRVGDVGERVAVGRSGDQQRGPGTGNARGHDIRHVRAGLLRDDLAQCLVFDLLEPGERERRAGVLVEEESPELGDELRVGGVAPVHAEVQWRAVGSVREHDRVAARLLRREAHVRGRDAELVERARDLRRGRAAGRRAEARGAAPPRSPSPARTRRTPR